FDILLCFSLLSYLSSTLSNAEATSIAYHQLLTLSKKGDLPDNYEFEVKIGIAITDPYLCCRPRRVHDIICIVVPGDPSINVVTGIDLNDTDIIEYLHTELGLLIDATLHINSNCFYDISPKTSLVSNSSTSSTLATTASSAHSWILPFAHRHLVPRPSIQRLQGSTVIDTLQHGARCYILERQPFQLSDALQLWQLQSLRCPHRQQDSWLPSK
ncbi:hypothetical protein BHM03_00033250, partial [Ensete ventricosum]